MGEPGAGVAVFPGVPGAEVGAGDGESGVIREHPCALFGTY